ncbi:RNA exonuclease 3 [Blumeria hordei DH14]|uniref:RNA exonuclease 3 n=1 Tax=Blumeria graminis f. sp. hordei (strain DH14) TaxID=546991 RepID=N1JEV3_BLUG1|nr:RNA exonuclease 3 [Blumeria hordei DH14]
MPYNLVLDQSSSISDCNSTSVLPEICYSPDYMECLLSFVYSSEILKQNGYIVEPLTESELERKIKCDRCFKCKFTTLKTAEEKLKERKKVLNINDLAALRLEESGDTTSVIQGTSGNSRKPSQTNHNIAVRGQETNNPQVALKCKFHDGVIQRQRWTCCYKYQFSDGCQAKKDHNAPDHVDEKLRTQWNYVRTPTVVNQAFQKAAVAIDCEMGGTSTRESVVIRVTMIDYFTSEVLVDELVYPDTRIVDYRTRFSGVTRAQMENAVRKRKCLFGLEAARKAIWKHVGPSTIIVGHSLNNDLTALRWIHPLVLDTMLIDNLILKEAQKMAQEIEQDSQLKTVQSEPVVVNNVAETEEKKKKKVKGSGVLSLKTMTRERLGRDIQNEKSGHDSLEDAVATRDIAHWNVVVRGEIPIDLFDYPLL